MKKRLPAYGQALRKALDDGREPLHGIGVWIDRAPPEHSILVPLAVFRDTEPECLDWSLCCGRDVLIPHADSVAEPRLKAVCHAIRDAGPRRLILSVDHPFPHFEFVVSVNGGKQ
ncbi:MAG: hypothetical protein FWG52_08225 [Proteobacteria bacterium]|nr:hypothetical protein [Pseudomonadota bacterium]